SVVVAAASITPKRPTSGFIKTQGGLMRLPDVVSASLVALGMVWSQGLQAADSNQAAPKDNKGFKASKTTVVDLAPEIEGMQGRQLRLRLLAIEPGGHIAVHSHKNRPAVVY